MDQLWAIIELQTLDLTEIIVLKSATQEENKCHVINADICGSAQAAHTDGVDEVVEVSVCEERLRQLSEVHL